MMNGEVNWPLRIGLIAALVVLLAIGGFMWLRPAKVTGETPEERIASIAEVAHQRRIGAGEALAKVAREDPVATVRQAAVMELAGFADEDTLPAVLAASEDAATNVREAATGTLAAYEADAAADRLASMLVNDKDEMVRMGAVEALGQSRSPKAVVILLQKTEDEQDYPARVWAARALAKRIGLAGDQLDPRKNLTLWNHNIEMFKGLKGVEEAFQRYGAALVRHPEHLIKPPKEH